MTRKESLRGVATFGIIAAAVFAVLMFLAMLGNEFGFTADMSGNLITLFPAIFLFMVSAWILVDARSPLFIAAGFMVMGIGLAVLLNSLHSLALLTDAMLAPATIQVAMQWSVVICTLLGGVCAVALRKK